MHFWGYRIQKHYPSGPKNLGLKEKSRKQYTIKIKNRKGSSSKEKKMSKEEHYLKAEAT